MGGHTEAARGRHGDGEVLVGSQGQGQGSSVSGSVCVAVMEYLRLDTL